MADAERNSPPAKGTPRFRYKISAEAHRRFALDVLAKAGAAPVDAAIMADALLWADLRGRHSQGLFRLPNTVKRLSRGLIRSPAAFKWIPAAPAAQILDAADGLGQVAGRRGMERAIELARAQGVGVVAVRHSNHYGAGAYYCALAAEAGCASLACTNAVPKVAAFGGAKPVLGTNPISFGFPTPGPGPVLVDLSTSALSGGEVRSAADRSEKLPPGVALDAQGRPTSDPAAIATGCLLPAAGPKGFALALAVEILSGVLTGAAVGKEVGSLFFTWDRPVNVGHLFVVIEIERFVPLAVFLERVDRLLKEIAASPLQEGAEPLRFPGEIRATSAERYAKDGIPVPEEGVRLLEELAHDLDVTVPWAQTSEEEP